MLHLPGFYLQGELALFGTKPLLTVLLQSLGFREDVADSAAVSTELKPPNPPCNNLETPKSFLTAALNSVLTCDLEIQWSPNTCRNKLVIAKICDLR